MNSVAVIGVFIPIILTIGVIIMIIYIRKYENDERMAMIDKGIDPKLFARKPGNVSGALRAALLLMGAGVGLLLGNVLDRVMNVHEPVAYFSMLFLCGGLGLGAAYLIEERKAKKSGM